MMSTVMGCGGSPSNAGAPLAPCAAVSGSAMVETAVTPTSLSLSRANAALLPHHQRLRGHLLGAMAAASDEGRVDDNQMLPVTVSLKLNHEEDLQRELAEIYNPGSPHFQRYLSNADFRAKYGPTAAQITAVTDYLRTQGLNEVLVDPSGMLVHAVGRLSQLGEAFGTEVHQYRLVENGETTLFRAPQSELQIPQGLVIQGVHGLQNRTRARAKAIASRPSHASPSAATGPTQGYSPSDIRKAYNLPTHLDASSETLALFELDGYIASDIQAYERYFGLPGVPLQNILVAGADGSAGASAAETTLDIELMLALAPNVAKILVYEGANDDQGILATYARIASDNIAKSVSTSWGLSEDQATASFMLAENAIFMQMAAQGQTIYSAAGDWGAKDNEVALSVDDPSAQPYMVAVGGTSLATDASGTRASETTWYDSTGGGGGGVSTVWTIPTWQRGLATTANRASSSMRNLPDVSLNSGIRTGYAIYYRGSWSTWGGTSAAAPLWAAFNALVNQARRNNGLGPLGYANPTFYALGRSSRFSLDFFDIADGSTNGYFPATVGFDNATGWGTLNAAHLLEDLSQSTVKLDLPPGSADGSPDPGASVNRCGS